MSSRTYGFVTMCVQVSKGAGRLGVASGFPWPSMARGQAWAQLQPSGGSVLHAPLPRVWGLISSRSRALATGAKVCSGALQPVLYLPSCLVTLVSSFLRPQFPYLQC